MATVYLASHPELGRRVAVKVLNPELARSDQMVQRFFNEARAATGIGHRGIVEVFDLGTLPSGAPYIVMELLDGESLADRMSRTGRQALGIALELVGQAASVMAAAHARGIVHRDLKPDNLFLVPDPLRPGRELLKVLDFGIAKLAQRSADRGDLRTRTGAILGTPRYMSPEQCRESRDVDHRTDVYSLGVVLYEMIAGAPPFVSSSWELAHMHIGVEPPALQAQLPDVPAQVAQVVHRALEKDLDARFQSMAQFESALQAAATGRHAVLPAAPVAAAEGAGPATASAPGRAWQAGATKHLELPAPEPARGASGTTLACAASEVLADPGRPRRGARTVPALVISSLAALVVIVGALAFRGASTTPATALVPTAVVPSRAAPPAAVATARTVEPPPPPVTAARPAAEGGGIAPTVPTEPPSEPPSEPLSAGAAEAEPATKPVPAPAARRRRRALAPSPKPAAPAPAPARPQEPYKI